MIEENSLDRTLLPSHSSDRRAAIELGRQRVRCYVSQRGRYGLFVGDLIEEHAAKRALVNEPQFISSVVECDPHAQMAVRVVSGLLDEQLPAHPEVHNENIARVQSEPEIFPAALRPRDRGT